MKYMLFVSAVLTAGPALADPGHLTNVAGHAHWLGAAALGAAIAIALWAGLKGRKKDAAETDAEDPLPEEDPQEA